MSDKLARKREEILGTGSSYEPQFEPNEEVIWSGKGSGLNLTSHVLAPPLLVTVVFIATAVFSFLNEFPAQFYVFLVVAGFVLIATAWFAFNRITSPTTERYWITNKRIMIAPLTLGGYARSFVSPDSDMTKRGYRQFKAIKVLPKRKSILFEPHLMIRGRRDIIPVFVGVDDLENVAQIAAETFNMTPIQT